MTRLTRSGMYSLMLEYLKKYFQVPWWIRGKREEMEDMTPIFKNTNISFDDIGETMQTYAKENGLLSQPRKGLI